MASAVGITDVGQLLDLAVANGIMSQEDADKLRAGIAAGALAQGLAQGSSSRRSHRSRPSGRARRVGGCRAPTQTIAPSDPSGRACAAATAVTNSTLAFAIWVRASSWLMVGSPSPGCGP